MVELSKEFFETLLQNAKNDKSIKVLDIHVEQACEKGDNFVSIVCKICLKATRKQNDFTTSLIIKQPHKAQVTQNMLNLDKMFQNETIAYRDILPNLQKHFKYELPIAKCFFPDTNCIVLEDLSAFNYEMIRNGTTLSHDQCSVVLQELAVLHASSIIFKQLNSEMFQYLSNQIEHAFKNNKAVAKFVALSFQTALQLLMSVNQSEEIKQATNILGEISTNIYERVSNLILTKSADATAILNHGDCWRNNILFTMEHTGKMNVKFIDFQGMVATSPALDLSYFLYIHMTPENRHQHIDSLLDVYLNSLHRILTDHDLHHLKNVYSKPWLKNEMTDFSLFGFMCSVWVTPVFFLDKNNLPDTHSINVEEQDAEYLVRNLKPELKDRMMSIILDFTKTHKLHFIK